MDTTLSESEEEELVAMLKRNIYLFIWASSDMLGINTRVGFHHLVIDPNLKLVNLRKFKIGKEKKAVIDDEV